MIIALEKLHNTEQFFHEVELTCDHPQSSYGQEVMVNKENGDIIDHHSWLIGSGSIVKATKQEDELFDKWLLNCPKSEFSNSDNLIRE